MSIFFLFLIQFIGVQGHGMHGMGETMHIPFPFDEAEQQGGN